MARAKARAYLMVEGTIAIFILFLFGLTFLDSVFTQTRVARQQVESEAMHTLCLSTAYEFRQKPVLGEREVDFQGSKFLVRTEIRPAQEPDCQELTVEVSKRKGKVLCTWLLHD